MLSDEWVLPRRSPFHPAAGITHAGELPPFLPPSPPQGARSGWRGFPEPLPGAASRSFGVLEPWLGLCCPPVAPGRGHLHGPFLPRASHGPGLNRRGMEDAAGETEFCSQPRGAPLEAQTHRDMGKARQTIERQKGDTAKAEGRVTCPHL